MPSKNHRKPRKRADFPRAWDLSRPSIWSTLRYAQGPLEKLPLPDREWQKGNPDALPRYLDWGIILDDQILRAVINVLKTPDKPQMYRLYELLMQPWLADEMERVTERIRQHPAIAPFPLVRLARFLIFNAPDLDPVTWALTWLALGQDSEAEEIAAFLGQHQDFVDTAAVVLQKHAVNPDIALWRLARKLSGYGRLTVIRMISAPGDPSLKAWLLREGFRNTSGNQYLALHVAQQGDLLSALRNPEPDQALIDGAADIFMAFMEPALNDGWYTYADGQEAFACWLDHVGTAPNGKQRRLIRRMVRLFARNPQFYRELPWSEMAIADAAQRCRELLS